MVTGDHIVVQQTPEQRLAGPGGGNVGITVEGMIPRPDLGGASGARAAQGLAVRGKRLAKECASVLGHKFALVMLDLYSRFLLCRALKTKCSLAALNAYKQWRGQDLIQYLYTDGSGELEVVANSDRVPHDSSEPGDPQASGLAERHVQEVKYGVAACLGQAGLPHKYWCYAMHYFETAWNVSRHTGIASSPWERRFGEPFLGMLIPFGAAVTFIPNKSSRLWHEKKPFGTRTVNGIFYGLAFAVRMPLVRWILRSIGIRL